MRTAGERVSILYQVAGGGEGDGQLALEVDVTPSIVPALAAEATQVPVEDGATISDHVLLRPDTLKLEGIVTNTPLRSNLAAPPSEEEFRQNAEAGVYAGRAAEARGILKAIHRAKEPVTIVTAAETYADMVMQGLEMPEAVATGDSLRFSASFVQIRTARAMETKTPPEFVSGKVSKGRLPTQPAPAAMSGRIDSMAKSVVNPSKTKLQSIPSH